jgi:hypothetical protein
MKINIKAIFFCTWFVVPTFGQQCFVCSDTLPGTIFCDDFESTSPLSDRYFEYGDANGGFVPMAGIGRDGSTGMRVKWQAGQVGAGGFKKSLGRTPDNYIGNHAVNPTTDYDEIYWRIDLRTQLGWQGGGADKLTRATTLANSNWAQGMIAHIWSAGTDNEFLVIDPASGIDTDGNLVTTSYNDFANLRWLGAKVGNIDLFSTENSDKWYCIEAHAKINTIGTNDGILEFWINDTLQAGSYNLNWHGDWNADSLNYFINAIFIENYWNNGSPVEQERYLDNFVISTNRIGCNCESTNSAVDIYEADAVNVFPNPTNNYLNVRVGRAIARNGYQLEILDRNGQSILTTEAIHKITYSHNLDGYSSGNYFFRLYSNSTLIKTGKLIVQKI